MTASRWVFTLHYADKAGGERITTELSNQFGAGVFRYICWGYEVCPSTGRKHLQGFFTTPKPVRMAGLKKLPIEGFGHAHFEKARGDSKEARDYCAKGESADPDWETKFVEHGTCPTQGERTDLTPLREVCDQIRRGTPLARIADDQPEVIVKHHRGLLFLENLIQRPYNHWDLRGIWIWGAPGVGKTRSVIEHYGRDMVYNKPQNRWWDMYKGEPVVLLDDYGKTGADLGAEMKIWADRYQCLGEIKGGTINLRHKAFVVTSNYNPEVLWADDLAVLDALRRKFIIYCMYSYPDTNIPFRPLEMKPDPDREIIVIDD